MANRASPNFVTAPIFLFCSRIAAHADFFYQPNVFFRDFRVWAFEGKCRDGL